jgi:hypothetical protein
MRLSGKGFRSLTSGESFTFSGPQDVEIMVLRHKGGVLRLWVPITLSQPLTL